MVKPVKNRPVKRVKDTTPPLRTDKESEDEIEQVKRETDEVEKYVEERRDSIRRGARRSKHRFRI